jgi:hypothetical protein
MAIELMPRANSEAVIPQMQRFPADQVQKFTADVFEKLGLPGRTAAAERTLFLEFRMDTAGWPVHSGGGGLIGP